MTIEVGTFNQRYVRGHLEIHALDVLLAMMVCSAVLHRLSGSTPEEMSL